jgi:hypothetical protein
MTDLTPEEITRREILTFKLKDKKLTYGEAMELKKILEKEKEKASSLNDFMALFAVGFFLAALFTFISDLEKEEKEKKKKKSKRFIIF